VRILTLDVGGTAIKSAIVDENNQLTDIRETPSQSAGEALVYRAAEVALGYEDYDVLSVSMTGQINNKTQNLLFQYNKDVNDEGEECPAGEILRKAVNRPVFLMNDSNCAALGEAYFGAGRGHKDFLCLTYGTGVGGGIIQNGELLTGSRGIAGEVGHMVIHAGGRKCGCGRRGCYERYAATTALLASARKVRPELENARQLFVLAEEDAALQRVIRAWVREIVEGLCTLVYIFNPDCIVLGGGVMERADVLDMVRKRFYKRVIPTFSRVELLPAQLGNKAGMYGALAYAKQQMNELE